MRLRPRLPRKVSKKGRSSGLGRGLALEGARGSWPLGTTAGPRTLPTRLTRIARVASMRYDPSRESTMFGEGNSADHQKRGRHLDEHCARARGASL